MSVGDWHESSDGHRFQETLHGPNVQRECVGCGGECFSIPGWPDPRCETCSIRHHGVLRVVDRLVFRERKPKWR